MLIDLHLISLVAQVSHLSAMEIQATWRGHRQRKAALSEVRGLRDQRDDMQVD